jgi:hypothetical protein
LRWIAETPAKWANGAQLLAHFQDNVARYIAQFVLWLVTFTVALTSLGHRARDFVPAFVFLYLVSVAIFVIGQWDRASTSQQMFLGSRTLSVGMDLDSDLFAHVGY